MTESGKYWKNRFNTHKERMKMLDEIESEKCIEIYIASLNVITMMQDEDYNSPYF